MPEKLWYEFEDDGEIRDNAEDWRQHSCCFTGHRILSTEERAAIDENLRPLLRDLIENEGISCFLAGGALGFDTIAALTVLELKEDFPHIRLKLILPCADQDSKWRPSQRKLYRDIIARADYVEYIAAAYLPGCMQARNRALVEQSSVCVCALRHQAQNSGTEFTVSLAEAQGRTLYNVLD